MPNFLVLSSARSGSSLFANYLNSHHDVRCWGEILNFESGINPEVHTLSPPDLKSFVKSVFSCDAGKLVGAKIHTHQLYELPISLSALLECTVRPRVIVLYREAILDTYVSLQIALQNNVWYTTDAVNADTVFVDWKHFQTYSGRERNRWAECLQIVKTCACASLMVSFERLVANTQPVMDEVFQFLGIPSVAVETESLRQNPRALEEKVSNWGDLPASKNGADCRLLLAELDEAKIYK